MIEAGVAGLHLEDQLSSVKKCGHMGGKVLEPVNIFVEKLITARLAADILGVPTIIIARTDAEAAKMLRSGYHPVDESFLTGEHSPEGHQYVRGGIPFAIERAKAFAPYADLLWCETSKPDLGQAKEFADEVHKEFPGKWLAYNCSPSFNWKAHLGEKEARTFQDKLAEMGYKFQFVTLAGFHTLNASMFELAHNYAKEGMAAYSRFQEHEFELQKTAGFTAIKHQKFVGTGYYDEIQNTIQGGQSSTTALAGSTEEEQF